MKLAYIIGLVVTVLLNQAFGTYLKKSSDIEKESPSTKPLQRHKLDENLKQTNKSDCDLNGSETGHLVIVKLPRGKDNRYIDHLNDRIFPIFPKDVSNSNAEDFFDGATDKRCAEDLIKSSDRILAIRGKALSLPGGNSEASKKAGFNQPSVGGGYNKATTTKQAHVFKRPGSYNDRPTLFDRPKLLVKLDPPKKPPKKVLDIFQSPLSIYERRKPTTGFYKRPQSPFGVGYKELRKGYEKPPGILVTDYHRPSLSNMGILTTDPLKIISNKDIGFESNPAYYPSRPFNNRFSSGRIFGKTNKLYDFPKLPITSKTGENIFQPKTQLKKKYQTPIIARNEGINKGLIIVTKSNKAILNKDKAVGIGENIDVTQNPVSYRRTKAQNDGNGSKRIDLLGTNDSEEVVFADPVHGTKNSSSKVIGLDNKESNLLKGTNDKESNLVNVTNIKETDLIKGMNDKGSDLVEGINKKENNLVDETNNKKTDQDKEMNDKESDLVEEMNNKESDLLEGMIDKENNLVEGTNNKETDQDKEMNDKESDLVEGMNDKENNLVDGTSNKETHQDKEMSDKEIDLLEGMIDKENNLVDGMNNIETDLIEGMHDKENNLVDGTNNEETDLIKGMNDKGSDLAEGINDKENHLVDGTKIKETHQDKELNDKESDLVEGMNDEENNLVDGTNNKGSDVLEGIKEKERDLADGVNHKKSAQVEETIDKESDQDKEMNDKESNQNKEMNDNESNFFHQTKIEEYSSKHQVDEEALMNNSLNHTSSEQTMFKGKNENDKYFIPSKEISTNVMDGDIKPGAITEMNSLNNEETTTFHYIDENINDKGNDEKLIDISRNTTSLSSNNTNDNRPTITVMINTKNYSEKEDKNKNVISSNESISQLSNHSPPDVGDYTDTNKTNKVSDLLNNDNENIATTPMSFLEISMPKAIHESLMNEHNSIHTTDKSYVEISKNSVGSNSSNVFTKEHNYESKEVNTRNAEAPSDYLSYNKTINKDDILPHIFNYSRELPKLAPTPEIIDYPPHELVEGQFVKLQPELFDRSHSESYLEKDMHKNLKNGQLSEVYNDKLEIPEKDKREYLFEEPLQHYKTEDHFFPKNEFYDNINNEYTTYTDYEDDYGKSRPPVLSSIMEDFPLSHKSKSVDDSLILHGSNIDDETVGSLDITNGYSTRKSENPNPYEASGPGPYLGSSHSESDTMTVDEFKRRGSHDVSPSYEYIDLNNPDSQLSNIGREDNMFGTTNYGNIGRENKEDLGDRTVAETIDEVRKMSSGNKYSKENLDLKSENDQIETVDSYPSKNSQSYEESEEHLINRIFGHIKPKNDDKTEHFANTDEYNIPKMINNYVYPEATGARTDSKDMRLNTKSSTCLGCDYGILSESKPTKESDEIINGKTRQSPKTICIHVDDKGDIKDDTMKLLYQVLANKTTSNNNALADGKLGDNSGENEGKEKISDNIFNLLVRHLNNANTRKQLHENHQNLLTTSKTEIDEETPAILDLSDQSSERKETYNHRLFQNPNKVQRPDGPFTDANESESKEFAKEVSEP